MKYDHDLETLFSAITHMHMICAKKEFDRRGIKPVGHPPILFILRHESENMVASQKEIADKLGISPPTVAISIKRMERTGLVQKVADKSDLRRNLITLTEKGIKQVDESKAVFEKVDEGMFHGLSNEEQEQLKELFLRIVSNLEAMGAQPPEDLKKGNL